MEKWKDDYLYLMTDDTGILQHSKYTIPDPRYGYTTDDNARALLLAILLVKEWPHKNYHKLLYRYTSFLLNAQTQQGEFKNFMSYERHWLEEKGSEDCQGRCAWAICTAITHPAVPNGIKAALSIMLDALFPNIMSLTSLRAKAYAIIGLANLQDLASQKLIRVLGKSLLEEFNRASSRNWQWFEDTLTYSNSILPWAMFAAYKVTRKPAFLTVAENSLVFLLEKVFVKNYLQPIGCNGWLKKGGVAAEFDQQPIEACEMILTLQEAFNITHKNFYLEKAKKCYAWYEGENSEHCCLTDSITGGCFDGITPNGVNGNLGAESQISYGIAYFTMMNLDGINSNSQNIR
ncbi:glycosyltransferase [Pectinatus haikarae]|uniref:Glycosyltransferase n=1 Tax=Pectinatus haikarae TaxID=349096 RepID=A0ABT9Y5N3_9FIRM|nr:glycosyltransferase [Pectinatus haikarae]MDQ0203138.1 hypothetical protein [Pectinatus haikarae]